jgi:hypothetical protein
MDLRGFQVGQRLAKELEMTMLPTGAILLVLGDRGAVEPEDAVAGVTGVS